MSYPSGPSNPYQQQSPAPQPGYGQPQQPGSGQPQPGYGQPQPGYQQEQPGYGYPQQAGAPATPGYGFPQQAAPAAAPGYGYPQEQPGYPQGQQYGAGYASWGSRLAAVIVDGLIIGVVPGIAGAVGMTMMLGGVRDGDSGAESTGLIVYLLGMLVGLALGLFFAYREGLTGQTPGKKVLKIRVVNLYDQQPNGGGMGILRWVCRVLNAPFALGYLWPLWDDRKQTFADKAVNTVVVQA